MRHGTNLRYAAIALALAAAVSTAAVAGPDDREAGVETDAALVSDAEASTADGVDLLVVRSGAEIEVVGRCPIHASSEVAWSVLTDYDGIERFVSSIRESRVTRRDRDGILVEQSAVARVFLFSRRLRATLRVREEPPGRIQFEDVLGRDFRSYRGEWRIEESERGVAIVYRLSARPTFPMPDFIMRGVFRSTARELMTQVRTEIERRAALAALAAR